MTRVTRGALATLFAIGWLASPAASQPRDDGALDGPPLALVVTFADGRVTSHEGGPRGGGFWTPMFPRIGPAPEGLPVTALKCDWKREDSYLKVAISILRGQPHQQEQPVAAVAVRLGRRVPVPALAAFGVAPIVLSAKPIAPVHALLPNVLNKTAGLEVTNIEVIAEPLPAYLVSVKNLSTKPAKSYSVESYVGSRLALSGRQGDPEGKPIIQPGKTHTFRWSLSSAAPATAREWAPAPIDLIAITSVLWDDDTYEGDRDVAVSMQMLNRARHLQLTRVVGILRAATHEPPATDQLIAHLWKQADALPILASTRDIAAVRALDPEGELRSDASLGGTIAVAFQQVKNTFIDDLRSAERKGAGSSPAMSRAFMGEIAGHYEAWLARVSPAQ